jgi:uncharacterized repeat protein (TIGR01451 family)
MNAQESRSIRRQVRRPWAYVLLAIVASGVMFLGLISLAATSAAASRPAKPLAPAAPIPPPEGYPKLSLSTKAVTPTLAGTGGATLYYTIEIRNTGATTATDVTLVDTLPTGVTYNDDGPVRP